MLSDLSGDTVCGLAQWKRTLRVNNVTILIDSYIDSNRSRYIFKYCLSICIDRDISILIDRDISILIDRDISILISRDVSIYIHGYI
jgi:hypothetical protein